MDFENDNIDPYEILGVPFGASIEVCKATYKSLSKIYHPDVFVGEKSYAAKRMAELNAAFEFLDNPARKKKWDGAGQKAKQKAQSQEYEPDNDSEEFSKASNALRENWDFACEYYPELKKLHANLRKLNTQIAFFFMAVIVEEKLYAEAYKLADHLEEQFLISKFGEDPDIKNLAKTAILRNEIKFAQDLNRALKILGKGSKEKILQKLVSDYPDAGYHLFKDARLQRYIPNNHPLKQKEFSEAASRHRSAEDSKRSPYDRDTEWLKNLREEDKLRKESVIRNWMLIAAVFGFGLLVAISF
jgi:curved DNA-binding protein CbpA